MRWAGRILILSAALVLSACLLLKPPTPDAFYHAPAEVSMHAGVLLRAEPFTRRIPSGSRAWRILYTTTKRDGVPALASAIVLISRQSQPGARHLVAWMHGTTGVVPGCAPSLLGQPFVDIPAIEQALDQGWVVVATDYVGLGTAGPSPFLIGEGEARSALDSIRAARQMRELQLDEGVVLWGASQGGHAALWSGILAPSYANDVRLTGVAAVAPATDLVPLVGAGQDTLAGRIISSMILHAYGDFYPDVRLEDYVPSDLQGRVRSMSGRCLAMPQVLLLASQSLLTHRTIFRAAPSTGPLAARLAENTPRQAIDAPLLIAQGDTDDLVLPDIQKRFVEERCRAGQQLEYKVYPGRGHISIMKADSPYNADLIRWTRDRFAGAPLPLGCSNVG